MRERKNELLQLLILQWVHSTHTQPYFLNEITKKKIKFRTFNLKEKVVSEKKL